MNATRSACALLSLMVVGAVGLAACSQDSPKGGATPPPATVTATATVTESPTSSSETPSNPETTGEPAPTTRSLGPFTVSDPDDGLTLVDIGWTLRNSAMGTYAHTGAVFYNNGPLIPHITINFQGISGDSVVDSASEDFALVPADSFIVMGATLTEMKTNHDTVEAVVGAADDWETGSVDATASLTATAPRSSGVYENVPISITNDGTTTIPDSAKVQIILVNAQGEIISGGDGFTSVAIPGGQTVRDVVQDVYSPRGTTDAFGYVDLFGLM